MPRLERLIWDGKKILTEDKDKVKATPIGIPVAIPYIITLQRFRDLMEEQAPKDANAYIAGNTVNVSAGRMVTAIQYYRVKK